MTTLTTYADAEALAPAAPAAGRGATVARLIASSLGWLMLAFVALKLLDPSGLLTVLTEFWHLPATLAKLAFGGLLAVEVSLAVLIALPTAFAQLSVGEFTGQGTLQAVRACKTAWITPDKKKVVTVPAFTCPGKKHCCVKFRFEPNEGAGGTWRGPPAVPRERTAAGSSPRPKVPFAARLPVGADGVLRVRIQT